MSLLKFSRGYWEMAVSYKGSDKLILRDYDLLRDRAQGRSLEQLSDKYKITRQQVCNILKKYK